MSDVPPPPESDADAEALAAEQRALDRAVALLAGLELAGLGLEPSGDDWT